MKAKVCILLLILGAASVAVFSAESASQGEGEAKAVGYIGNDLGRGSTQIASTNTMPPPIGMPLIASKRQLLISAENGSAEAANRLFDGVLRCLMAKHYANDVAELNRAHSIAVASLAAEGRSKDDFRDDLNTMAASSTRIKERVDSSKQFCAGAEDSIDDGQIYNAALLAAHHGNDKAAACFMSATFDVPKNKLNASYGLLYKANVDSLIGYSIQRGNWAAVRALVAMYGGTPFGGLSNYTYQADPGAELKYQLLLRLGVVASNPKVGLL
ncbi:MAG: hypothetical protein PF483_15560, partial [Halothiobacillus sp.]|nr:hypothetical protein [Halothiobacillus sp.]